MKKTGAVLAALTAFLMMTALPAAAGYAPPPPVPGGTHGARGVGGTAFTGSDLSVGAVLLGVLVVVGIAAVLVGRRVSARRHPAASS